jgi:hypothetical protein
MNRREQRDFLETLDAAYEMHGKTVSSAAKRLWVEGVGQYPLSAVQYGFSRVLQTSPFLPKLADVRLMILSNDGRPSADEAWAIAVQVSDEGATVVWTDEISTAWMDAKPIIDTGDNVAARMAFKSSYNRAVDLAREGTIPIHWKPSLGHDISSRHAVLRAAYEKGHLSSDYVQSLLPTPEKPMSESVRGFIAGSVGPDAEEDSSHKPHIRHLRSILGGNASAACSEN